MPLCFTWISELGKFFGGRAKHLGKHLTKKGVTLVRNLHKQPLFFKSEYHYNNSCDISNCILLFFCYKVVHFVCVCVCFFLKRKTQFTCTAVFLVWGVLVHLVIPPFVFMSQEGWTYIEGLYFSFVTLTTIGFGDFVAGG